MPDRAVLLGHMADEFMNGGGVLPKLPLGCIRFTAAMYPVAEPREVHFSATWTDVTLVCKRSLEGWSLEGGLHRESIPPE